MFPAIDRKWAIIIGIVTFIVGLFLLPINKYRNMITLKKEYPYVANELIEAYNDYILQKENLEKIQVTFDRSLDINNIKNLLSKNLNITINEKNHTIHVKSSVAPEDVYKLIRIVTTTSNLRFEKLHLKNPTSIPITVFPLDMVNSIDLDCIIEYLEVKP